ncbi:MAG: SH3 domain-containing protein [Caldilineaceae bacterium]
MKTKQNLFAISILFIVTLFAGGCIRPEGATQGATTGTTTTTMTNTETVSNTATVTTTAPVSGTTAMTETGSAAMATVSTTSLRVRTEPNTTSQQVASAKQGETYKVIGLSSDGQWVELAIDKAPGGKGWVSANFVTVMGSITDVPITQVGAAQNATPSATQVVTATSTATTATPTTAMTETATATTTEATPTQAVTETATTTATTEATATPALTGTATTTATAAVSVTIPTPGPGMAVINTAGPRLRVRSEPNADAPIVGYAYPGETYEVLGKSDDGLWVHIAGSTAGKGENPNGGWVSANFVIIGQ